MTAKDDGAREIEEQFATGPDSGGRFAAVSPGRNLPETIVKSSTAMVSGLAWYTHHNQCQPGVQDITHTKPRKEREKPTSPSSRSGQRSSLNLIEHVECAREKTNPQSKHRHDEEGRKDCQTPAQWMPAKNQRTNEENGNLREEVDKATHMADIGNNSREDRSSSPAERCRQQIGLRCQNFREVHEPRRRTCK